jgi:5-dehydro-2-deoxygluconokinase
MGCVVFDGAIPDDVEQGHRGPGFPVEVFNILGAGDAFMAGFLRGWVRDEPLSRCCAYANACGALVVSRHGCAPAMPSADELAYFLEHGSPTPRLREDTQLERLHRQTTRTRRWADLVVLAFDHRAQFVEMASPYSAGATRIAQCKALIAEGRAKRRGRRRRRGRHRRWPLRRGSVPEGHGMRLVGRAAGRASGLATARIRSEPGARDRIAHVAR